MSFQTAERHWNDLQTLYGLGSLGARGDGQLLEHFRTHDGPSADAAFQALVERHGPMVLRVCRAILSDEHDAQDAFQATFLVLIRKSKSVRNQGSVGSWLHGVARRVASRARVEASRRHAHERKVASFKGSEETAVEEAIESDGEAILRALDEEISRLPEKYRAPLVLCYLEGLTQERAAEHLGWPSGTVRGRLARARELLRSRLSRRGLVTPASVLAVATPIGPPTAATSASVVPQGLILSTVRTAALGLASTQKSTTITLLAASVVRSMMVAKLKLMSLAVLGLGLIVATAGTGMALKTVVRSRDVPPKPLISEISPLENLESSRETVASPDFRPERFPSAQVFPMTGLTIDGDLGDWPLESFYWHPIKTLDSPEDETDGREAKFAAAYDLKDQRIYLAIQVTDDRRATDHKSAPTDAVEVFVEAREVSEHLGRPQDSQLAPGAASRPMLQYSGFSTMGKSDADGLNPTLIDGDCRKTRTAMKSRTVGNVTTYEWAIQVFDRYPDRPAKLEAGRHVGFDIALVERGGSADPPGLKSLDHPWVCWGSYPDSGLKGFDVDDIGELILTEAP